MPPQASPSRRPRSANVRDLWAPDARPFRSSLPGKVEFPDNFRGTRLMRPAEKPQLLKLYSEVWGDAAALLLDRRWSWLFDRNPFSSEQESVIPVQVERGEIQAFQFMFPQTYRVFGKPCRMYMVAALTGMEARPGGLLRLWRNIKQWPISQWGAVASHTRSVPFSRLFFRHEDYRIHPKAWFERETEVPDPHNSYPAFFEWSWPETWTGPLQASAYLSRPALGKAGDLGLGLLDRLLLHRCGEPKVTRLERFPGSLDPWLKSVAAEYPLVLQRDSEYLNWRYVDFEGHRYQRLLFERGGEPLGYAVTKVCKEPGRGRVWDLLDVFARRGRRSDHTAILRSVLREAKGMGVGAVRSWDPHDPVARRSYKQVGFRPRGTDDRSIILWRTPHYLEPEQVNDRANWPFQLGDIEPSLLAVD